MLTDGQTNMTGLIVAFRDYVKAPNKRYSYLFRPFIRRPQAVSGTNMQGKLRSQVRISLLYPAECSVAA
jgi:hypothetical protein